MPKYTDAGILEPLDSYIEKDGLDKSAWVPAMMELYSDKGAQYGMPKGMDVVVVAYNKGIFDKYGVEYPKEGWTWDEFVAKGAELRDKIAEKGEGGISARNGDRWTATVLFATVGSGRIKNIQWRRF